MTDYKSLIAALEEIDATFGATDERLHDGLMGQLATARRRLARSSPNQLDHVSKPKPTKRGKTGESRKLNSGVFYSLGRRKKRPWVIVNEHNEPVGRFLERTHADDWHKESGEGERYRVMKEIEA